MPSDPSSPTFEETKSLLADGIYEMMTIYPTKAPRKPQRYKVFAYTPYALLCIVCTVINAFVFNAARTPEETTVEDVLKMRRPNQFPGLERITTPHVIPEPTVLYPTLLSMINQAEPDRVYGDDPVKFAGWPKTDPPIDRTFKVTSKFSSIVEFMSIDYKMENCELFLRLPETQSHNSSFILGPGRNQVHVWSLDVPYPSSKGKLSWNTRPKRGRKLDTITISYGTKYVYRFHCSLNSFHSFEFSAADESTHVEWSQDRHDPTPAVLMSQDVSDSVTFPEAPPATRNQAGEHSSKSRNPLTWDIPEPEKVAMHIVPGLTHFELGSPGWQYMLPEGGHVVHVANSDGTVATKTVAMFHQMRCLQTLYNDYMDEGSHQLPTSFTPHCLNYLRQTLLCHMDLRTEPQSSSRSKNGGDELCYDWDLVYAEAGRNFEAYSAQLA